MSEATANIGVVGLAVMGSNLARNLASREGNTVAVYNRSRSKTDELLSSHPEAEFVPAFSYEEFAASLTVPRTAIIMVKAGAGTDAVIDELVRVFEPGDIIVDGGNALFTDTIRREKAVRETGINFVGMGVSGGEEGALLGPSLMPGGSDADRADQDIPTLPGAGDAGPAGEIHRDGSEADGVDTIPGAGDAGPNGPVYPEGSEADILEQKAEVPVDDDGYPRGPEEDASNER